MGVVTARKMRAAIPPIIREKTRSPRLTLAGVMEKESQGRGVQLQYG
jgi:hypothetical protein